MGKARKNNVEASNPIQVTGESNKIIKYAVCLVRGVAENCMRESKNVNGWINGCTSRQSPNCTASSRAGVKAIKKTCRRRHEGKMRPRRSRGGGRTGNGIMIYRGVAPILPYAWSSERVNGAGLDGGSVLVSTRTLLWGSAPRLYVLAFGVGRYRRRGFAGVNVEIWRGRDHVAKYLHRV